MISVGFCFGAPLSAQNVHNRKVELNWLLKAVEAKKKIIMTGCRRIGKSSLCNKLEEKLKEDNWAVPVHMWCYPAKDFNRKDFFVELNRKFDESLESTLTYFSKLGKKAIKSVNYLKDITGRIQVEGETDFGKIRVSLKERENKNEWELEAERFFFKLRKCVEKGVNICIIFDEYGVYQDVPDFQEGFYEYMNSKFKGFSIPLILSGSQNLLRLGNWTREYEPMPMLDYFSKEDTFSLIDKNKSKEFALGAKELIFELTDGHPLYIQMIGSNAERYTPGNSTVTKNKVMSAYEDIVKGGSEYDELVFESYLRGLKEIERKILSVIAKTGRVNDAVEISGILDRDTKEVLSFCEKLDVDYYLKKTEDKSYSYEFRDKIFEEWLKRSRRKI